MRHAFVPSSLGEVLGVIFQEFEGSWEVWNHHHLGLHQIEVPGGEIYLAQGGGGTSLYWEEDSEAVVRRILARLE